MANPWSRLAVPLSLSLVLSACGEGVGTALPGDEEALDNSGEGPDFVLTPTTGQALSYAGGAPLKLFLNFAGGTYRQGGNDSSQNVTSAFKAGSGLTSAAIAGYAGNAAQKAEILGCVRERFASWNVSVTETDPGGAEHTEMVVGGSSAQLGYGSTIAGVAPLGCDVVVKAVGFAFTAGRESGTVGICQTIAHEAGHTLSLDHLRSVRVR